MSSYLQPSRIHDLELIGKKLLCVECKTRTSAKRGLIAPMCERIIHQECWAKHSSQCDQCVLTISEPSIAARRLATGRANRPPVQLLASSSDSSSSELDASMGGPGGNGRGQSRGRSRPRPHQANSQAHHRTESVEHRHDYENPSGSASSSSRPAAHRHGPSGDLRQRKSHKSEDRNFQRARQVALVPGISRADPHVSETEQQLYVGMARSIVYYGTLGVAYLWFFHSIGVVDLVLPPQPSTTTTTPLAPTPTLGESVRAFFWQRGLGLLKVFMPDVGVCAFIGICGVFYIWLKVQEEMSANRPPPIYCGALCSACSPMKMMGNTTCLKLCRLLRYHFDLMTARLS